MITALRCWFSLNVWNADGLVPPDEQYVRWYDGQLEAVGV